VIKSFLKHKITEQPEQRISLDEYNKEGLYALERVKRGNFYTHEEITKMSKEW